MSDVNFDETVEAYKERLRVQFRSKKREVERLEREISQIKQSLGAADELIAFAKQRSTETEDALLPDLGRYRNAGVKEAICDYFARNPFQESTISSITDALLKEGLQTGNHATGIISTTARRLQEEGFLTSVLKAENGTPKRIFSLSKDMLRKNETTIHLLPYERKRRARKREPALKKQD